jgi:transposase-like protein
VRSQYHEFLVLVDAVYEGWRQVWSNNPQERLNREIRRRTDCAPGSPSAVSLNVTSEGHSRSTSLMVSH